MKTYVLLTDEVLADLVKQQDKRAYTELYQHEKFSNSAAKPTCRTRRLLNN